MKPIKHEIQKKETEFLRVFCSKMRNLYSEQSSNLFLCLQCGQRANSEKKCSYCQTGEFLVPNNQHLHDYLNDYLKLQGVADLQYELLKMQFLKH